MKTRGGDWKGTGSGAVEELARSSAIGFFGLVYPDDISGAVIGLCIRGL
jgi:hypothetical protein